jgi:septum formation protein
LTLILASGSSIRHQMLKDAGVEHMVVTPDIDEDELKQGLDDPAELAAKLAQAKAVAVSRLHPEALVIGGDSVVTVDGRLFDKPRSREEAADHLRFFSGKPLRLNSAVVLARGGAVEWSHVGLAGLDVRALSEEFIQAYLDREWPAVSHCVGVFRIEGPGIQLFDTIAGGHFTILGMPLIPLLKALRERGYLQS